MEFFNSFEMVKRDRSIGGELHGQEMQW